MRYYNLVILSILGLALNAPNVAADPVLTDYLILAGDKVTVGGGSTAVGLVGCAYTGAANQFGVTVAGGASIQGDCRALHNIHLNNDAHITGNAIHPSGTNGPPVAVVPVTWGVAKQLFR